MVGALGGSNKDDINQLDTPTAINGLKSFIILRAFGSFERMITIMLVVLLRSLEVTLRPESLAKLFEFFYTSFIKKLEVMDNLSRLNNVWLDCLMYNIRITFKTLWIHASTNAKSPDMPKIKFIYPIQINEQVRESEQYLSYQQKVAWRKLILQNGYHLGPWLTSYRLKEKNSEFLRKSASFIGALRENFALTSTMLKSVCWYLWHKGFNSSSRMTNQEVNALDCIVVHRVSRHFLKQ